MTTPTFRLRLIVAAYTVLLCVVPVILTSYIEDQANYMQRPDGYYFSLHFMAGLPGGLIAGFLILPAYFAQEKFRAFYLLLGCLKTAVLFGFLAYLAFAIAESSLWLPGMRSSDQDFSSFQSEINLALWYLMVLTGISLAAGTLFWLLVLPCYALIYRLKHTISLWKIKETATQPIPAKINIYNETILTSGLCGAFAGLFLLPLIYFLTNQSELYRIKDFDTGDYPFMIILTLLPVAGLLWFTAIRKNSSDKGHHSYHRLMSLLQILLFVLFLAGLCLLQILGFNFMNPTSVPIIPLCGMIAALLVLPPFLQDRYQQPQAAIIGGILTTLVATLLYGTFPALNSLTLTINYVPEFEAETRIFYSIILQSALDKYLSFFFTLNYWLLLILPIGALFGWLAQLWVSGRRHRQEQSAGVLRFE
ncbi:hypothetical protein O4H49_03215 [Kiloniella laminariae]|uniref:Uncharacterized protein n=1 Tax=Kiloniella laminariae TaxID=454162 RepID=A0ABT4LF93_9PROT|nr:hypothetical protein [Kiloniella laminariae]MCZ4279773.1 hypothetical protein [Kiloniella laminariae]